MVGTVEKRHGLVMPFFYYKPLQVVPLTLLTACYVYFWRQFNDMNVVFPLYNILVVLISLVI